MNLLIVLEIPSKQGMRGWREALGMLIDQQPERAALNLPWVLKWLAAAWMVANEISFTFDWPSDELYLPPMRKIDSILCEQKRRLLRRVSMSSQQQVTCPECTVSLNHHFSFQLFIWHCCFSFIYIGTLFLHSVEYASICGTGNKYRLLFGHWCSIRTALDSFISIMINAVVSSETISSFID